MELILYTNIYSNIENNNRFFYTNIIIYIHLLFEDTQGLFTRILVICWHSYRAL